MSFVNFIINDITKFTECDIEYYIEEDFTVEIGYRAAPSFKVTDLFPALIWEIKYDDIFTPILQAHMEFNNLEPEWYQLLRENELVHNSWLKRDCYLKQEIEDEWLWNEPKVYDEYGNTARSYNEAEEEESDDYNPWEDPSDKVENSDPDIGLEVNESEEDPDDYPYSYIEKRVTNESLHKCLMALLKIANNKLLSNTEPLNQNTSFAHEEDDWGDCPAPDPNNTLPYPTQPVASTLSPDKPGSVKNPLRRYIVNDDDVIPLNEDVFPL